jgi:hypothetical protein
LRQQGAFFNKLIGRTYMTSATFSKLLVGGISLHMLLSAAAPPPISFFARRDTVILGSGRTRQTDPSALAIADFNGDGLPDVAVISSADNQAIVFLSQGNGSFKAGKAINAGPAPGAIVAGDFNGDGHMDMAIVSAEGTGIFLGKGDGTFKPVANIRNAFGNAIAVADFNGDGKLDLVVGDNQFGTLDLLLGNGDGTFQPMTVLPAAGNPVALAVADLNGDGSPDLVVATGANDQIVTLLNNGKGTFSNPQAVSVAGAIALAIGDFNGDGKPDVACATLVGGTAAVVLLLGEGNGQLGAPTKIVSEGNPTGVAIVAAGDFNGDGHLDLVASLNQLSGNYTLMLEGNGDGTFQKPAKYSMGSPQAFGVADFNGDGRVDIVTANGSINTSLLSVLLGEGNGEFQTAPQTALTAFAGNVSPVGVASADLNGDGLTDFVAAESSGAQVLLAAGGNQFTAGQFIGTAPTFIALADVNGDGRPDLIMTTSTNNVAIFLGNGDGTFQPALNSNAGAGQFGVAVGDFNGDGKPDLALIINSQSLGVMLGDGNGNFAAPVKLFTLGTEPDSIAVGDFNKDGKLDVVVSNYGDAAAGPASISVFPGNGDGTFAAPTNLALPGTADPWEVAIADLNGDGNLDIVSSNNNESYISIYLGNGDGTFKPPSNNFSAFAPLDLVIADVNGDGIPDIAFLSQGEYDLGVLAGKGDGTFAPAVFFGGGSFPEGIGVGTLAQGEKPGLLLLNDGFLEAPAGYTVLRNTSK